MPQVHNRLVAEFNTEPEIYDPDEAVAKGAALYALKESLQDQVQDFLTTTVAALGQSAQPVDLADVSEEEVTKALDHLEKQLGFTLTGPVRELVNTRIVNVLSKSLGVIARTSVMRFKQNGESMGKVGSELGAQYVLEGSVRRDADKVRISAQLIQTKDQTRIWSRQYDRELKSLLALQVEIAQETADEIQLTLGRGHKLWATDRKVRLATS